MDYQALLSRPAVLRPLIGLLTAFLLAASAALGLPAESRDDQSQAAKVARKLERAKARAARHQAKEEQEALKDFKKEVDDYVELHQKLLARLGGEDPTGASPRALAQSIAAARRNARQGDLLRPDVQPILRRLISEQLKGPDTGDARKAVSEGNPKQEKGAVPVTVTVNGDYSAGAPLSTVPASVLVTLPPLPLPLQYRFVGRDLILLDSVANLIVDFLPGAAPALQAQ